MAKYLLIFMTLFVTACSSSQPVPIDTSIPPTQTPQPIEITFDGNDCTVTGPTELPAGDHTFVFIDQSDVKGELYLVYLDKGKTFQDLLDGQSEPGEWYPKPSWALYDRNMSTEREELEGRRVDTSIFRLDKVAEHTILCYVSLTSPQQLWIAAPLMVVEATSD